jgi:predicted amidohydrolase
MKLTVVQWNSIFCNVSKNYQRLKTFVEKTDSDIFVFPELFFSGYNFERKSEILHCSLTKNNLLELLKKIKIKNKMIIGGFSELSDDNVFNSAFAFSAEKFIVYRKIHLWFKEKNIFIPGNKIELINFNGIKIGLEICYDLQFPELARLYSSKGAQLIIVPMAWPVEEYYKNFKPPIFVQLAVAQSFVNGIFTAIANKTGIENGLRFDGYSGIVDPYGIYSGLKKKQGKFTQEIDFTKIKKAKNPTPKNNLDKDRKLICKFL